MKCKTEITYRKRVSEDSCDIVSCLIPGIDAVGCIWVRHPLDGVLKAKHEVLQSFQPIVSEILSCFVLGVPLLCLCSS